MGERGALTLRFCPSASRHQAHSLRTCGPEAGQLDSCMVDRDAVLHAPLGNLGLTRALKKSLSGTQTTAALWWRVPLYRGVNLSTAIVNASVIGGFLDSMDPKPTVARGQVSQILNLNQFSVRLWQSSWGGWGCLQWPVLLGCCTAMVCMKRSFLLRYTMLLKSTPGHARSCLGR